MFWFHITGPKNMFLIDFWVFYLAKIRYLYEKKIKN